VDEGAPRWPGDADVRRLFARVGEACAGEIGFPARLEAGLRVALGTLAAEPELARLITFELYLGTEGQEQALVAQRAWVARFADLLAAAAAADPQASDGPAFLAPFLIGGLRFRIARIVLSGRVKELPGILPGTLEALIAYYFEPGEPRRLALAALAPSD
jgi:hypothetical protein